MPFTLALLAPPNLPEFTPVPLLERWLLGSGITGALLALALGIVAWLILARLGRPKTAIGVLFAGAVIAGGVFTAGQLVVTDLETLRDRTALLVEATGSADRTGMTPFLDPEVRVETRFGSAQGRDRVLALATSRSDAIRSANTREVRAELRGSRIARTLAKVRTEGEYISQSSWWMIEWQRQTTEGDWLVTHIEPVWIQGIDDPGG